MRLIVCLDDRNGILFLGRRLSWDSAVGKDILRQTCGSRLWMTEYSAERFEPADNICIAQDYIEKAGAQDYCFAEEAIADRCFPVEELTVYRWNRAYPSDVKFPLERAVAGMHLQSREEFAGSSHDNITREVYTR